MTNSITTFNGPAEVELYAFIAIRRALKFRVDHPGGPSLMRGQEIRAARNHGWTDAKTARKALADMNSIAEAVGMPTI
jgi:hypothetical protein